MISHELKSALVNVAKATRAHQKISLDLNELIKKHAHLLNQLDKSLEHKNKCQERVHSLLEEIPDPDDVLLKIVIKVEDRIYYPKFADDEEYLLLTDVTERTEVIEG